MSHGIKVSKSGYDVGVTDDENLVFSSESNTWKTSATGTKSGSGNVAHGLSFTPIFFSMRKVLSSSNRHSACWGGLEVGVDSTNLNFGYSGDYRYYILYQQAI